MRGGWSACSNLRLAAAKKILAVECYCARALCRFIAKSHRQINLTAGHVHIDRYQRCNSEFLQFLDLEGTPPNARIGRQFALGGSKLTLALTSALAMAIARTTSKPSPQKRCKCKGVSPYSSLAFTLAPRLQSGRRLPPGCQRWLGGSQ